MEFLATRQMGTAPLLEDMSDSPVPVGVAVSGQDLSDPGLGVMFSQQDVLSRTVLGSGDFFPESCCSSTGQAFVGALLPGHEDPSPASRAPEWAPTEPGGGGGACNPRGGYVPVPKNARRDPNTF